jgi:hypothetical protein
VDVIFPLKTHDIPIAPVVATALTTHAAMAKSPFTPSTTTIPSPSLTATATNTTPPTIMYAKETKLTFSTYKPSIDYSHWKALCLLEAANNPTYNNIAIKQGTKYTLNHSMSDKDSSTLYLSTMKALGTHAFNIISITDTESANGVELWTAMDEHFNEKEDSFLLKHEIKCNFQKLRRNPTETIDNYRIRFEKQLHLMTINAIALPSRLELVFQFLTHMNIKKVFDDIIMKMDSDDSFFSNMSWKQLSQKSARQIKLYQKIHPDQEVYSTKTRPDKNNQKTGIKLT